MVQENNLLLSVRNLQTVFRTSDGVARAVDGVTFTVRRGSTLGMVGESGCGKSVTALSILRLIPDPPGRIEGGEIVFDNRDLVALSEREMRKIRGNRISMIFQEPMTSLNPVFTVGSQIAEVFRIHRNMGRREAFDAAVEMLERVRIPNARQRAREYPHQMSGGMRQRVMIAMALACHPALLIADEPTTALDVTVQAQILNLMNDLQEQYKSSILIITHDLGVIAEMAEEVVVMYAGMIVEHAAAEALFSQPAHPYTRALFRSIPRLDDIRRGQKLESIEGTVPSPLAFPAGCRFHPRCKFAIPECREGIPPMVEAAPGHEARCIRVKEIYH
ncbi:MAG: ABC transporter ATP-binding protein [Candidatus Sumerlaeia bacterium]|nr:ABC transporter ATP-binding protein [Candidatus Sumerlaeia bacterium]